MVARALGVTERTIRNWIKASQEEPKRMGRPPRPKREVWLMHLLVAREWKKQGRGAGWRPIAEQLEGRVGTRRVQASLKRLKANRRRRERRRRERMKKRTTVLCSNAIWCQDATHVGRLDNGQAVEADVVKDRGSLSTLGLSVGSAATGDDVVLLLKTLQAKKGDLPLVLQTDNGSAERAIGELKAETGLGRGRHIEHAHDAGLLLASAASSLNSNRLRGSKGYRTANTLANTLPSWYNRVTRDRFYREAGEAIRRAEENNGKRRARHAANEAVLMLLERHGIVERTRGVLPNHGT